MRKPVILFDLDMLYPWVPQIYEGLRKEVESQGWRVILATYQGQRLVEVSGAVHNGRASRYAALVTANVSDAEACVEIGFPCVYTAYPTPGFRGCAITSDYAAMGRIAAEELLRCGYSRIALIGGLKSDHGAVGAKTSGFLAAAKATGGSILLEPPIVSDQNGWLDESSMIKLATWAKELSEPVGIAAVNVRMAWCVARALRRSGKRVPDDLALIAIGEDPVLLGQARPPVSGVAEDGLAIGRMAGRMIQRQVDGERVEMGHERVAPRGVVRRESSDFFSATDPVVAKALTIIWRGGEEDLSVEGLAQKLHVSRATLLRRFRVHRGHPPNVEVQQARLRRAIDWITRTDRPLAEIADLCGFGLQSALSRAIRRETGKSPSTLRRDFGN